MLGGEPFRGQVIYTGQADELFRFAHGPLPYRTLKFEFETLMQADFQNGYGTVNYTVAQPYTRITEFKHLTGQKIDGVTTIVKEHSLPYGNLPNQTPYYAIINPENNALYEQYKKLGEAEANVVFAGRLGAYKYYDMAPCIAAALELCESELGQF